MQIVVREGIGRIGDDGDGKGGERVDEIILRVNSEEEGGEIQLTFLNYGATMRSALVPNKNNISEEVILCATYDELISIESKKPKYVGTIGRVSNRIAKGIFTLHDKEYHLATNNGVNHLHGGIKGFDKRVWNYSLIEEENRIGIRFSLTSPDMEEGYPGTVQARAEYCLTKTNDLTMKFTATTDQSTPISMTNHTFWNLSGGYRSNVKSHHLHLSCGGYLPIDTGLIPLGHIASVENTPFDFTTSRPLGPAIDLITHNGVSGIDHSFISANQLLHPHQTQHIATLSDLESGRQLIIHSNQPAIQIYTGNFLPTLSEDNLDPFHQHNGICLENQGYPNAVNEPSFPSIIVNPGEEYVHEAIYSFRRIE